MFHHRCDNNRKIDISAHQSKLIIIGVMEKIWEKIVVKPYAISF